MKYLTEFTANGELQTLAELTPEEIERVKQYILTLLWIRSK